MPLPIALPAVAKGAAALSAALGLTAAVISNEKKHSNLWNTEDLSNAFVQQNLPLITAINIIKSKKQQPVTTNIPTAENALVLRPEYRTEVIPVTYDDLIMESRLGDAWGVLRGKKQVAEQDTSDNSGSQENPKPENPKNNDKKPFWKSGLGKAVKWTGGIAGTALAAPHLWNVGSWYFMDYVPSQIKSRNQESTKEKKSEEKEDIQITDTDREWAAQFYTK